MSSTHDTTANGVSKPGVPDGWEADADAIIREINRPQRFEESEGQTGDVEYADPFTPSQNSESLEWRWLPKHDMDLPGFEEPGDNCGEDMIKFCSCCGGTTTVGRCCRRSVCSRCAQEWCLRSATKRAAWLKAAWAYQLSVLDHHPFYHHVVISPPSDLKLDGDPETVYDRTLGVVKGILDHYDMAGMIAYHGYRGDHEDPGQDDRGEWKNRQFSGRDFEGDVEEEVEFSPHFHVVGISPHFDVGVTEQVEAETGWAIHRIEDEDGVSIGNDYDMASVVSYVLSHTMIDTSGEHNTVKAHYHGRPLATDDLEVREDTEEQMDAIVRTVAPRTLGIPASEISCQSEVGRGEGEGQRAQVTITADGDGTIDDGTAGEDCECEDDDPPGTPESDPDNMETCRGKLMDIWDAPAKLEDSDWVQEARHVHELRETYQKWSRNPGWIGAVG